MKKIKHFNKNIVLLDLRLDRDDFNLNLNIVRSITK